MSPLAGQARLICLEALRRGLVSPEDRDRAVALLESLTADSADPSVLVEEGLLRADQVDRLARDVGAEAVSLGADTISVASGQPLLADPSAIGTPTTPQKPEEAASAGPDSSALPRSFGDDFELLALIGQGGMGQVYRAYQKSLRRHVALKLIKPSGIITEDTIQRFHIEAQAAARLSHPNIVSVHHVGVHEGQHFLTMDLVDGSSLSGVVRDGKLPLAQRLELLEKVARAVHHAHTQGIVHRDLKPGNILVDTRGEPLVTDFGLAKDFETDFSLSISSAIMGTPSYMSPEQALGRSKQADARSDVYSLGAILYEMLVGQPPCQAGNLAELLRMIVEEDPVPPHRLSRAVPPDVETICLKALSKEPDRRYQTAQTLASDVRHYLDGEPIQARPSSIFYRTKKRILRNKALATVGAFAILITIGLLVAWLLTLQHRTSQALQAKFAAEEARDNAQLQEAEAKKQRRLAEDRETTTRRYLYAERMRSIQEAWERRDTAAVLRLLDGLRPLPGQLDIRGWEWHHYWRLCHSEIANLGGHEDGARCVAFSADGKTVVTGGDDKAVKLWDAASGKALRTLEGHTAPVEFVFFRPDGTELLTGAVNGSARLWDLESGADTLLLREQIRSMALSHDGRFMAVGGGPTRTLKIWDLADRRMVVDMGQYPDWVQSLAFSPGGKTLAMGLGWSSEPGEVRLLDIESRKETKTFGGFTSGVFGLAFSPEGSLFAARAYTRIRMWDLSNGKELAGQDVDPVGRSGAIAFSPDGKLLAAGSGNRVDVWEVPAWSKVASFVGHTDSVLSVAFSPNGRMLASSSADGSAKLWRMDTSLAPAEEGTIVEGVKYDAIMDIAFSPDGALMATASYDKTVKLWDTATMTELAVLRGHTGAVNSVDFSSDGRLLATASNDKTARLWNVTTRSVENILTHSGSVWCARFHPSIERLSTTGYHNLLRDWSTVDGSLLENNGGQQRNGTALSVSQNAKAKYLAVAERSSADPGSVQLWDWATRKWVFLRGHTDTVYAIAFSPDGTTLATGSKDQTVRIWDLETKKERTSERRRMSGAVHSVVFSRDSASVIASGGHYASQWLVGTGAFDIYRTDPPPSKQPLEPGGFRRVRAHSESVRSLRMSPDDKLLASGSSDGTLKLWDTSTWEVRRTLAGHASGVTSVAFSPDGKQLVAGGKDFAVRLYDRATRSETKALQGHTDIVNCVAFSPDGTLVASAGYDTVVRVWDLASGQPRAELPGHALPVRCLAFSPDGKTLVSGDGCTDQMGATVRFWSLATGEARAIPLPDKQSAHCTLYFPDGQCVAASTYFGSSGEVKVWDASTGEERPAFAGHRTAVRAMAFSPDGRTLATASADDSVKLWDVATRKELATLFGHESDVAGVAFGRDGKTLLTAGLDKTLRVWDLVVRETRAKLAAHDAGVRCLASSPDGEALATVGSDGSLKLWRTAAERDTTDPPGSIPGKSAAK